MKKISVGTILGLLFCLHSAFGQTFTVTVNAGNPFVFQTKTGGRSPVTASTIIAMGDSLILSPGSQVTIGLETNSRLIFKGPGVMALTGDTSAAYLSFDQGQVFLDRAEPTTFSVLTFWVRNYMFVPVGTAAAIRVMSSELPAVAVIEGKMLMQSPAGESVEISAGNFGCVDGSGRITQGTLGKKVVAALEKWSGVKAGAGFSDAKASSLEMVDQEFTAIAAGSPAASPSTRRQPPKKSEPSEQPQGASAAGETAPATGQQTGEGGKKETAEAAAPSTGTSPPRPLNSTLSAQRPSAPSPCSRNAAPPSLPRP